MESTGDIDQTIACGQCGGDFTVRQLIVAADGCWQSLEVVRSKTPCCQATEELWLRDGLASRGYVYAAGQAHFADMEQYAAPGMVVVYSPDQVSIRLVGCEKLLDRK